MVPPVRLAVILLVALTVLSGCAAKPSATTASGTGSTTSSTTAATTQASSSSSTSSSATTGASSSGTTTGTTTSSAPNHPPLAGMTASVQAGSVPLRVNFTLTASDPDGQNVTYSFDADGKAPAEKTGSAATLDLVTNFTYAETGIYNATFTASDGTNTTTVHLQVNATAAAAAGTRTDYSCKASATTLLVSSNGVAEECAIVTTDADAVLVASTPAASCSILAGGAAVVLNQSYPSGTKFTHDCPITSMGGTGAITLLT